MVHEYLVKVHDVLADNVVEITVDLGFGLTFKTKVRLSGVKLPTHESVDVDERLKAHRVRSFLSLLSETWTLRVRTKKPVAGDGSYMYRAEFYYVDERGDLHSVQSRLVAEGLAVKE